MKFGVSLPNNGPLASVESLRVVATECDKLGYDSIWITDHMNWSAADAKHHFQAGAVEAWKYPIEPNYYEPLVTLSYLAGITQQIKLGTAIIVLPLRNPVVLAKQAACLDQLTGGRLIFGVGLGGGIYASPTHRAVGVQHLLGKRGKVVDEWIDVIKCVWEQPKCTFQGQFIQVTEAEVFPKPMQRPGPPVWIGGQSEAAMRRVAHRGDGWLQSNLLPQEIEPCRQRISQLAAEVGRDAKDIQISGEHWLSIAKDTATAESRAAGTLAGLKSHPYKDLALSRQRGERQGHVAEYFLFGDPDTIIGKLIPYQQARVDHVILRVIARDLPEMIDSLQMFKEEVVDRRDHNFRSERE